MMAEDSAEDWFLRHSSAGCGTILRFRLGILQ